MKLFSIIWKIRHEDILSLSTSFYMKYGLKNGYGLNMILKTKIMGSY